MTPARGVDPHAGAFRRRALETSYWAFSAVLLVVYCGAQIYADLDQRQAFSMFFESRGAVRLPTE